MSVLPATKLVVLNHAGKPTAGLGQIPWSAPPSSTFGMLHCTLKPTLFGKDPEDLTGNTTCDANP